MKLYKLIIVIAAYMSLVMFAVFFGIMLIYTVLIEPSPKTVICEMVNHDVLQNSSVCKE